MAVCTTQVAKTTASMLQAQKDQTAQIVNQLADDMVQNISANKAWQDAVQMQVQTLDNCQVIIHKPVYIAPKFDPGGCDPPTLQPGTPPTFTKAVPGSWTPGRAAYFTPGFWTPEVKPQWVPGTPAVFNPGTKGAPR